MNRSERLDLARRLHVAALGAAAADRYADALVDWERALEVADDLVATGDGRAERLLVGAICYGMGESLLRSSDYGEAVSVLDRAEQAYQAAPGAAGTETDDLPSLIADVQLRRARVQALRGRLASALADSQAGMVVHLDRWSGHVGDEQALATARPLALHGWVTAVAGDPDMAVAALDTSVTIYRYQLEAIIDDPDLRAVDVPHLERSASLAYQIHVGRGRLDEAAEALFVIRTLDPDRAREAEELAQDSSYFTVALSLDQALALAGATELRERLTPDGPGLVLTPVIRCSSGEVQVLAMGLGAAARTVVGDRPDAVLRIVLEAHAMLASGLTTRSVVRFLPGTRSMTWADLLLTGVGAATRTGQAELVEDFEDWIRRLLPDLEVLAPGDRQVAATLQRCRDLLDGSSSPDADPAP